MSDIVIYFRDEIRCVIDAEKSVLMALYDHFSYDIPGAKFMPAYKFGQWSGKVSMLNLKDRSFYTGLLPQLLKVCKEQEYTVEIFQEDKPYFRADPKPDPSFLANWKTFCKFPPKDYQEAAFNEFFSKRKILSLISTGGGKSFLCYLSVRYRLLCDPNCKILINVPSKSLAEQLISDFKDYTTDGWDVDKFCDTVHSDNKNSDINSKKQIVISTWQSTCKQKSLWFEKFDTYICDEAHMSDAAELSKIIDMIPHIRYRLGMSGTLDGTNLHVLEMIGRFGTVHKTITTQELMERGDLAQLKIECKRLNYSKDLCRDMTKPGTDYPKEITWVTENETRNQYLVDLAMEQTKNTLMLFNYVERHGLVLVDQLRAVSEQHLKRINIIHGKIKTDEREIIRKRMDSEPPIWYDVWFDDFMIRIPDKAMINSKTVSVGDTFIESEILPLLLTKSDSEVTPYFEGTFKTGVVTKIIEQTGCDILAASYGTLAVGVNLKNLHRLIFCHPLKARIKNLQSIGRILRAMAGKGTVILYDLCDNLCYTTPAGRKRTNFAFDHFVERLKIYQSEGFDYEISDVDMSELMK